MQHGKAAIIKEGGRKKISDSPKGSMDAISYTGSNKLVKLIQMKSYLDAGAAVYTFLSASAPVNRGLSSRQMDGVSERAAARGTRRDSRTHNSGIA